MNAFMTAPRYLLRPLELWRKRHKILLWRRLSYTLIQKLNLQERFKVRYYGAYFHPFPTSLSLALWLFGEQFRSQDLIDVEGYELPILKAGERTLSRGRFLYEVGDRHSLRFGYSAQQLMEFLYQTGWRMFRFEEQKHLVEVTPRYHLPDVENLVCARSPEELMKRLKTYTVQMR